MLHKMMIVILLAATTVAQTPKRRQFEQLSAEGFTVPKDGFVPAAEVAVSIAEAVLVNLPHWFRSGEWNPTNDERSTAYRTGR